MKNNSIFLKCLKYVITAFMLYAASLFSCIVISYLVCDIMIKNAQNEIKKIQSDIIRKNTDFLKSVDSKITEMNNNYELIFNKSMELMNIDDSKKIVSNDIIEKNYVENIVFEPDLEVTSYCNGKLTASGEKVNSSYISVSRDLFKKWGGKFGKPILLFVYEKDSIRFLGIYYIHDLMAKNITKTLDVYMNSKEKSLNFGRKKGFVIVLE